MKKIVVFADSTWSIGRVHCDIAAALKEEYEFIFHNESLFYLDKFQRDYRECDVCLTTPHIYNDLKNFLKGENPTKILFIAHCYINWNDLLKSPNFHKFTYCTISEVLMKDFPAPVLYTPSGINPSFFEYKERTGHLMTLGWCGNLSWASKRVEWSYKIAEKTNLAVSLATRIPFETMKHWYHTIDLLLVTSGPDEDSETGPLPPFEAIFSGVPVIGTRVGNFQLIPGPKFSTIEEATAIIKSFQKYPESLVALAKEQYEYVRINWTVEAVVPKWRNAFETVIKKSKSSFNNFIETFYDFIEIGTSDFDTEIEKMDSKYGISIEPIKYYLDKLPNKQHCIKRNIAISNYSGTCCVYYLSEKTIQTYGFPYYVRGCNSINSYHKTVTKLCNDKNLKIEEISEKEEIPVQTLVQTMDEMNIEGVYYLKIDTEGHDTSILKKFYEENTCNKYLPHVILFESNILSKKKKLKRLLIYLQKKDTI